MLVIFQHLCIMHLNMKKRKQVKNLIKSPCEVIDSTSVTTLISHEALIRATSTVYSGFSIDANALAASK